MSRTSHLASAALFKNSSPIFGPHGFGFVAHVLFLILRVDGAPDRIRCGALDQDSNEYRDSLLQCIVSRKALICRASAGETLISGMATPGWNFCGCVTHFSRLAGVFGRTPASHERCGRAASDGPTLPTAPRMPGITWQVGSRNGSSDLPYCYGRQVDQTKSRDSPPKVSVLDMPDRQFHCLI